MDHPPACLDAKLLWADALERLILANCVDQFDLASLETVWAWDGEDWERLSDDGPPATVVTGFGWDPDRDVLVRYGGIPLPEQTCITETWEWDMTEWRQIDADSPDPCDHIELAWDAVGEQLLLFGGGRGPDLLPGTWEWNGSEWSNVTNIGPAPRAHHGMVGSLDGSYAVVDGGLDNGQVFADRWAWDGSAWEDLGDEPGGSAPGHARTMAWLWDPMASSCSAERRAGRPSTRSSATYGSRVSPSVGQRWRARAQFRRPVDCQHSHTTRREPLFVLYGGFDADGNPLSDTWEWNTSGEWRCVDGCGSPTSTLTRSRPPRRSGAAPPRWAW